jgi:hypothetical protein
MDSSTTEPGLVVLDVDGCIMLVEPGYPIRPGILTMVKAFVQMGHEVVLWSAGGEEHAKEQALRAHIDEYVSHYYRKPEYPMTEADSLATLGRRPVLQIDDDHTERVADWPFLLVSMDGVE